MTSQTTERAFEVAIVDSLIHNGSYQLGDAANFSRELAFDKATIFQFIQTSQLEAWRKLKTSSPLLVRCATVLIMKTQ